MKKELQELVKGGETLEPETLWRMAEEPETLWRMTEVTRRLRQLTPDELEAITVGREGTEERFVFELLKTLTPAQRVQLDELTQGLFDLSMAARLPC